MIKDGGEFLTKTEMKMSKTYFIARMDAPLTS